MRQVIASVVLVFSIATAQAADPAANGVLRLESAVAQILNRTIVVGNPADQQLLLRIANRFMAHFQEEFDSLVVDPNNPTNNEKAQFVLLKLKHFGQEILRTQGSHEEAVSHSSSIHSAGTDAASDLE